LFADTGKRRVPVESSKSKRVLGQLDVWFVSTAVCCVLSLAVSQNAAQASVTPTRESQSACLRDARTYIRIPMPRPAVLTRPVSSHFQGTLTLDPAPATARPAVSPRAVWAAFGPGSPGGTQQLFLAYVSSSIPASLEPNGSLKPWYRHVLAWVSYAHDLPFDTAGIGGPPPHPKPTCKFVGQGLSAWDATSGGRILDSGFVPASRRTLNLDLKAWTPQSPRRSTSSGRIMGL
jgi:hypothetical protein